MDLAALALGEHAHAWGHGPWWPIFPIFWILFWVTIVFFVFRARGRWGRRFAGPSGEEVLAERYARGEISDNEYRERLAVLRESK